MNPALIRLLPTKKDTLDLLKQFAIKKRSSEAIALFNYLLVTPNCRNSARIATLVCDDDIPIELMINQKIEILEQLINEQSSLINSIFSTKNRVTWDLDITSLIKAGYLKNENSDGLNILTLVLMDLRVIYKSSNVCDLEVSRRLDMVETIFEYAPHVSPVSNFVVDIHHQCHQSWLAKKITEQHMNPAGKLRVKL